MNRMKSIVASAAMCFSLTSLSLLSTGCASDSKVIDQARAAHSTLSPAVITDPQLASYLQQVGDRVVEAARQYDKEGRGPASHREKTADNKWMFDTNVMKFHFVNSKTLNAFTTGGEHMYIYTQLFEECKSEDELAAVMSHEFAHVYSRHVQAGMNRQIAITGASVGAGAAGSFAGGSGSSYGTAASSAVGSVAQFAGMSYTREDENEADKVGFSLYCRAGWDPTHFADFFQHMIDQGLDTTPQYMSDHPSLKNRVIATRERVKNLGDKGTAWRKPPVAVVAQFQQLQQRAIQVGGSMPDDQSLQKTQLMLAAIPRSCWTPMDGNLKDQQDARVQLDQLIAARQPNKKTP